MANERKPLTPYERWMAASNMDRVTSGETTPDAAVATLRGNGYARVADAVAAKLAEIEGGA